MNMKSIAASFILTATLAAPLTGMAQETAAQARHRRAVASQKAHDHQHHTGAKIVVGSAAGGAVIGALAGGPTGALIGGALGAGGGAVVNKVRVHKGVKKREHSEPQ